MFEPIHGSAFDITGKGIANAVATFWTAAMMLEHLGERPAAERLMKAVEHVTADPSLHTPDLGARQPQSRSPRPSARPCGEPTTRVGT
jgi:tartrate dehydrogenase/decarboxylase/D-malate dehydrogenase